MCRDRNKMIIKKLLAIVISIMMLCACSLTESGSTSDIMQSDISVSELSDDITGALAKEYGQFSFSPTVMYQVPSEVSDITLTTKTDFTKNAYDIIPALLNGEKLSDGKYTLTNDERNGGNVLYRDEKAKLHANVSDNGFTAMFKYDMFDMRFMEGDIKKNILRGEDGFENAPLFSDSPEITTAIAIKAAEGFVDEAIAPYEQPFTLIPCEIRVIEYQDRPYVRVMFYRFYKGVKLAVCDDWNSFGENGNESFTYIANATLDVYLNKDLEVNGFTNGGFSFDVTQGQKRDSVIPLSAALDKATKEFSDRLELDVVSVNLKYIPSREVPADETVIGGFGIPYKTRIVWEVLIKPAADVSPAAAEISAGSVLLPFYVNIDAATGDIDFYLGTADDGSFRPRLY